MSSQMDEMMKMMKKMMSDNEALREKVEKLEKSEASVSSDNSRYDIDTEALLALIMKFSNGNDSWEVVKCAYYGDPASFKIVGTLHTDGDGKAYYSMKWTMANGKFRNFHLYGTQKFSKFLLRRISMFAWRDKVIDLGEFGTPPPPYYPSPNPCDFFERSA